MTSDLISFGKELILLHNLECSICLVLLQIHKSNFNKKVPRIRLENEKSDIELLTLKKIIEAGLDRELKNQIR